MRGANMETTRTSIHLALKDEIANIYAMSYGIPNHNDHRFQIMLCKKKVLLSEPAVEHGPFLLIPKSSAPEYKYSSLGSWYIDHIKGLPFIYRYAAWIHSYLCINVNDRVFEDLYQQQLFPLWPPSEPMKYFHIAKSRPIRTGFIATFRVFELVEPVPRTTVEQSSGWKGRPHVFDLYRQEEAAIRRPVLNDDDFDRILGEVKAAIGSSLLDEISLRYPGR
jgi:hypothetical protein